MTPEDLDIVLGTYDKKINQYRVNLIINPDDEYSKHMLEVIDHQVCEILNKYHNDNSIQSNSRRNRARLQRKLPFARRSRIKNTA
jgi:hypothetical protein